MDLSNWIRHHADRAPGKPALVFAGEVLTYADLADRIDSYARVLREVLGVEPGDRVAYLGYNSPELVALLFACARTGAIFLPLNWRLAAPEHLQLLRHAEPKVLFVGDEYTGYAQNIAGEAGPLQVVCLGDAVGGWASLPTLEAQGRESAVPVVAERAGEDDGVLLCYTSGTTGMAKGALLSKKALYWNALNSIDMHDMGRTDTVLTLLPMFHVGGLNIQTLPALFAGATVIILPQFDVDACYRALAAFDVTLTLVVPTVMLALMADERWSRGKPDRLRMIAIGSTIVPGSLVARVCEWGVPLVQVYGSTETCPIAAYTPPGEAARKPASTGIVAKHCEIRIVDADGAELATGKSGEILVRGPNVMLGYWRDDKATREAFGPDDWFHTGDIGHFDAEGFLYVDERLKDMIISGGENVYPAQVENLLAMMEGVREVAVVGRADDYWGEVVVAVVVEEPGFTVDAGAIRTFCDGRIAHFSCPREVLTVERLPRNVMGKVVKDEVRRLVAKGSVLPQDQTSQRRGS
ncbi:MAG: AMP-binding protein [Lysobacterales bacterium]|jgi:fatty-acyl-CoA synthase